MPAPAAQIKRSTKAPQSQPVSPRNTTKVTIQAAAIPTVTSMLTIDDELEKKRLQQRADYALHVSRATLLQRRKRWVDAIIEYTAALAAVPNDIVALRNRVVCRIEAGLLDEALVDAKKVLAVEEELHRDATVLGRNVSANTTQKQSSQGGERDSRPPYQGLLLLGKVLYAKGEFEEASRIYFRGKSIRPDVEEFHRGAFQCEETLRVTVRPRPPPPAPAPVPRRVHLEDRVQANGRQSKMRTASQHATTPSFGSTTPSVAIAEDYATNSLSTFRSCMPEFDNDVKFLADLAKSRLFSNKSPNLNNVYSEELYRNLHNHPANENIQPPGGARRPQTHFTAPGKRAGGAKSSGLKKTAGGTGKDDGKKAAQSSGAKGQHRSMTAGLGWTQDELEKLMYLPQDEDDERTGKGSSRRRRKSGGAHALSDGSKRNHGDDESDHSSDAGSAASSPRRMGQRSASPGSPQVGNRSASVHSTGKQSTIERSKGSNNDGKHSPRASISTTASLTTAATIPGNSHQSGPSRSYDAGLRTLMDRIAKDKRDSSNPSSRTASKLGETTAVAASRRVPLVVKSRPISKAELDFSHVKASAEKNAQMEHAVQETLQFLSGRRLFWLHNDPSIKFPEEDAALAAGVKGKNSSMPSAGTAGGTLPGEEATEDPLLRGREAEVVSRLSRPTSATSIRQSLNAEAIRLAAADRERHRLAARLDHDDRSESKRPQFSVGSDRGLTRPRTSLAVPVRPLSAMSVAAKQELNRILTLVGAERPNLRDGDVFAEGRGSGGAAQTPALPVRRGSSTFQPTRPTSAPVQGRRGPRSDLIRNPETFPDTPVTSGEGVTLETHRYGGIKDHRKDQARNQLPEQKQKVALTDGTLEDGDSSTAESVDGERHRPSASELAALQKIKQQLQGRLAYEVEVRTGQSLNGYASTSGVSHGAAFASEGRASSFGLGSAGVSLGISNRAKLGANPSESSRGQRDRVSSQESKQSGFGQVLSAEALGRYLSSQAASNGKSTMSGGQPPHRMLQLNANDRGDDDDDGTASATSSAGRSVLSDSEPSSPQAGRIPTGAQPARGQGTDPTDTTGTSQLPVSQSKRSLSRKRMLELSKEVDSRLARLTAAAKSGDVPTALSGVRALIAKVSEAVTSRSDDALLRSEMEVKLRLLHSSILLEVQEVQAAAIEASKAVEVAKKGGRRLHSWYLKAIRHTAQIYRHGDEEVLFLSSELDRPRELSRTVDDAEPIHAQPPTERMFGTSAGGSRGNMLNPSLDVADETDAESDLSSLSDAVPNEDSGNDS